MTSPVATAARKPLSKTVAEAAVALYFLGACAYLFYGVATETGLYGWVMARSMAWTGSAGTKLTFLVAMLIAFVPLLVLVAVAASIPDPGAVARAASRAPAGPAAAAAPGSDAGMLAKVGLFLVVAPAVIGYGIAWWLDAQARADVGVEPERIVLRPGREAPAPAGRFVALDGAPVGERVISIGKRGGSTADWYVPLGGSERDTAPVRYVLWLKDSGEPTADAVRTPIVVEVERSGVPTPVREAYEKGGLRFSEPAVLVRRVPVDERGRIAFDEGERWLWVAVVSAVCALAGVALLLVAWRMGRAARRAA